MVAFILNSWILTYRIWLLFFIIHMLFHTGEKKKADNPFLRAHQLHIITECMEWTSNLHNNLCPLAWFTSIRASGADLMYCLSTWILQTLLKRNPVGIPPYPIVRGTAFDFSSRCCQFFIQTMLEHRHVSAVLTASGVSLEAEILRFSFCFLLFN